MEHKQEPAELHVVQLFRFLVFTQDQLPVWEQMSNKISIYW